MDRETILTEALAGREQEVLHYQINVDNYTLAIEAIDKMDAPDEDMLAFRGRLTELLASEKREQAKADLLRGVIKQQVDDIVKAKARP